MLKKFSCFLCVCLSAITPIMAEPLDTSPRITLDELNEGLSKVIEELENPSTKQKASCVAEFNDTQMAQLEDFMQTAEKAVIMDFWAPWCPPCVEMKPIFAELAQELHDQYLFVSVNIDESPQIATKYNVTSFPTFKVIKNTTLLRTFIGYTSKESFVAQIEHAIHQKFTPHILLSAIQTNDIELLKACLAHQEIDVNAISQMQMMQFSMPMTPLMMASSTFMLGVSSMDMVSLLLNAGAKVDLEMDFPEIDSSMNIVRWNKISARSAVEQAAKTLPEETLALLEEHVRKLVLEYQAKAKALLELFQKQQPVVATSDDPDTLWHLSQITEIEQ